MLRRCVLRFDATILKGRPTNPHAATRNAMKYIPPPRKTFHPARFGRENMDPADLTKEWAAARGRNAPGNQNSGYGTKKEITYEDSTIPFTPIHELSKFMPDITVPAIQSTPVSMMHARNGHRVSHDLIHSYDPYISKINPHDPPRKIDHDDISAHDEKHMGLHPSTFGSRARIFRYLRRSPHYDEAMYYRNYILPTPIPPSQVAMQTQIVALSNANDIDGACAVYRILEHAPTPETLRAMMRCCANLGLLGDAAALFEDALRIKRSLGRDPELMNSYLDACLAAHHPARAMVVLSYVIGHHTDNYRYKTEVPDVWKHKMGHKTLVWLLTNSHGAEAQSVYVWLASANLLNYDNYEALGVQIAATLADKTATGSVSFEGADARYATTQSLVNTLTKVHAYYRFLAGTDGAYSAAWLEHEFPTIDLDFVLRMTRSASVPSATDDSIATTAHGFLLLLYPEADRSTQHTLLPFLQKTRPSKHNPNVRVVPHIGELAARKETPSEAGYKFGFGGGDGMTSHVVTESLPALENGNIDHLYYGRKETQQTAAAEVWF